MNIGDRVGFSYYYCGECEACHHGNTGDCAELNMKATNDGYYVFFGFADYKIINSKFAIKLDKNLPSAETGFF